jgi:hypothetical protein
MVHSRTLESTWQWYKLLDFRFHMLFLVLVLVLGFFFQIYKLHIHHIQQLVPLVRFL